MAQKCRFSQRSAATTTSRLSTSPLQSAKPPAGKKKRSLFFGHPRFYSKPNVCQDRLGTNIRERTSDQNIPRPFSFLTAHAPGVNPLTTPPRMRPLPVASGRTATSPMSTPPATWATRPPPATGCATLFLFPERFALRLISGTVRSAGAVREAGVCHLGRGASAPWCRRLR